MNDQEKSGLPTKQFAMTEALRDEEADDCFGQFKGFNYSARLLDVHTVLTLDRIKTEKLYERKNDPETGEPYLWKAACTKRLGITHTKANDMIKMLHVFGRAFLEAMQGLRLPRRTMRLMLDAPPELQADVLAIQEAAEDERQKLLDELVAKNTKQGGVIEEQQNIIARQDGELQQRKKSGARGEERERILRRQLREAQAEYVPSEDETDAANELAVFDAQLRATHRRICAQIEAMPDSHDVLTIGFGIRDNLVKLADALGGVLVGPTNKQAKGKE